MPFDTSCVSYLARLKEKFVAVFTNQIEIRNLFLEKNKFIITISIFQLTL